MKLTDASESCFQLSEIHFVTISLAICSEATAFNAWFWGTNCAGTTDNIIFNLFNLLL